MFVLWILLGESVDEQNINFGQYFLQQRTVYHLVIAEMKDLLESRVFNPFKISREQNRVARCLVNYGRHGTIAELVTNDCILSIFFCIEKSVLRCIFFCCSVSCLDQSYLARGSLVSDHTRTTSSLHPMACFLFFCALFYFCFIFYFILLIF